ncbi:MAG TPA: alpha/beta fold hydrolase [Chloroflexia bacterium]|nr:alpha/beta fold hydrolase [Chloroflexia bacterium]
METTIRQKAGKSDKVEAANSDAVVRVKPTRSRRRVTVRIAIAALAFVLVSYLGISGYVADKLSHPARKVLGNTPDTYGLKYEAVQFSSTGDGIQLKGWFIDSPGNNAILMMHGRNGIRDDAGIGMMEVAQALVKDNYDVLTFDFRAHGQSGGDRYSLGKWETRDIAGALNYLKGRGVGHIGTLAYSMGAATELLAAPDHPEMEALIADSAFADLPRLLEKELPKASGLPSFFNPGIYLVGQSIFGIDLLSNKPLESMPLLKERPVLLIHSTTDELIPVDHAYQLQAAGEGNPNLALWVAPGSGHVKAFKNNKTEYLNKVLGFFDRYLPR